MGLYERAIRHRFHESVRLLVVRARRVRPYFDGKRTDWKIEGPHFGGWEIYHMKGSPANPNRIYLASTSWFGSSFNFG